MVHLEILGRANSSWLEGPLLFTVYQMGVRVLTRKHNDSIFAHTDVPSAFWVRLNKFLGRHLMAGASLIYLARRVQVLLVVLLLFLNSFSTVYADDLDYRPRGAAPNEYFEGRSPNRVSGADVELLSAQIEDFTVKKRAIEMPPEIRVRINLPKFVDTTNVELEVREIVQRQYYRMKLTKHDWHTADEFAWPTATVVQKAGVELANLGAVARINDKKNERSQWIAPVVFIHNSSPTRADTYLFKFKIAKQASTLKCSIYNDKLELIVSEKFDKQRGNTPFAFMWPSTNSPWGKYQLLATGVFSDGSSFEYSALFDHQPILP
jgi:hypothetical protein